MENELLLAVEACIAFQRLQCCLDSLSRVNPDHPLVKAVSDKTNPLVLDDHIHDFNIEYFMDYHQSRK